MKWTGNNLSVSHCLRRAHKNESSGVKIMTDLQIKRVLLACSSFLFVLSANASDLTTPNEFSAGTAAVAAEVNVNFAAVETAVNDNDARIGALEGGTSTTDVFTFFLPDEVTPAAGDTVGTASLTRTAEGVNVVIDTTMLTAGAAYTIWWVVFNNPAACDPAGCTGADLGVAAVEGSVLNATGRVADANGEASFSAFLPAGFIHTNPASENVRHAFGPGLQNVAGAEVHLVVRCHGMATGNPEQISTLFGDCATGAGPSGCFDAQAMVFVPPM